MSLFHEYTDNFFIVESSILHAHPRLLFRAYHYEFIIPQDLDRPLFREILVKFTYSVEMIADQNFYDICCFTLFYSYGFGYGLRPKAEVFHGRSFVYGRR